MKSSVFPLKTGRTAMFALGSAYLDPDKQRLTIGARSITLQRKPYQVLLWLIENCHGMVYCEELYGSIC
jgi:DNA-binding response OmpR family regulator